MRRRGFTLAELMISLAMATAVAAAALMASAQLGRVMSDTRRRAIVFEESKRLVETLVAEFQQSGGSPLGPHHALLVENGTCVAIAGATTAATVPACDGHDRVMVTSVRNTYVDGAGNERSLGSCDVVNVSGGTLSLRADTNGVCSCLFPDSSGQPSPYTRSKAVLVRERDGFVVPLNIRDVGSGCAVTIPTNTNPNVLPLLEEGSLVPVVRKLYFTAPDPTLPGARQIRVWTDVAHGTTEPDSIPSLDEVRLFADHVYSFQVALGYDAGDDGDLLDRAAIDDEWVGNAVADTRPPAIADDRLLRMVGVGAVVGDRVVGVGNNARIFDGATIAVPGIYVTAASSKVALRNLNVSVP
jgi:prepilin-type N-terminal cleavage/methylation domain-containing protein